jgi:integrase
MKDLILFAWHTGLRFGEIVPLTWKDIDFEKETIEINKAVARGYLGTTKSNKTRQAFMSVDVREMLLRRRTEIKSALVFPNEKGKFLIYSRCLEWLNSLCEESGVRKIGWHTFRHTFASHLVEHSYSLRTVQGTPGTF